MWAVGQARGRDHCWQRRAEAADAWGAATVRSWPAAIARCFTCGTCLQQLEGVPISGWGACDTQVAMQNFARGCERDGHASQVVIKLYS